MAGVIAFFIMSFISMLIYEVAFAPAIDALDEAANDILANNAQAQKQYNDLRETQDAISTIEDTWDFAKAFKKLMIWILTPIGIMTPAAVAVYAEYFA